MIDGLHGSSKYDIYKQSRVTLSDIPVLIFQLTSSQRYYGNVSLLVSDI
jgi:hypothetical protein